MAIPHELKVATYRFIAKYLSKDELIEICFILNVKWDDLAGEGVSTKAMNLVQYLDQRELRFDVLLRELAAVRRPQFQNTNSLLDQVYLYGFQLADQGNWQKAAIILQLLSDIPASHDQLRLELTKRFEASLQKQAWDAAEAYLQGFKEILPSLLFLDELLSQHPRQLYQQAAQAQQQQEWDRARQLFEMLAQTHLHYQNAQTQSERLKQWERWYVGACRFWEAGQWDEAKQAFAQLQNDCPNYKETPQRQAMLQAYASGSQSMDARDYPQAIASFTTVQHKSPVFLQHRLRADLERLARQLIKESQWDNAQYLLEQFVPLLPDPSMLEPLLTELQDLGKLYRQARDLIHQKAWESAEKLLAQLSTKRPGYADVNELLADIQRLRKTTAALETGRLRVPGLRWEPDFPYEVLQAAGLKNITPAASMQTIDAIGAQTAARMTTAQQTAWESLRAIDQRLSVDALFYPVEQPAELVASLEADFVAHFRLPSPVSLAERLPQLAPAALVAWGEREQAIDILSRQQHERPGETGLAHKLGLLYLAAAEQQNGASPELWRQAIGQWVIALTDDEYWQSWGQLQAIHYSQQVLPPDLAQLPAKLEEELDQHLSRTGDKLLRLEFQAELIATRLLRRRDLGGIPTAGGGPVCCGPSLLETLGLADSLASYLAMLTDSTRNASPDEDVIRRLRWYFSSLRLPAAALEGSHPDPERAQELLRNSQPQHDIAYRALLRPDAVAQDDLWRLMTEARLRMAEGRMTQADIWDLRAIRTDWSAALGLARRWDGYELTAEMIRATGFSRTAALARESDTHPDTTRLDCAIKVLEIIGDLTQRDEPMLLKLNDLLVNRAHYTHTHGDRASALRDLERAFAVDPNNPGVRFAYASMLAWLADDSNQWEEALALLDQAENLILEGQRTFPDYELYQGVLTRISAMRVAIATGSDRMGDGDPLADLVRVLGESPEPTELSSLKEKWELQPEDKNNQQALLSAIAELAKESVPLEQRSLFASWRQHFVRHHELIVQLDRMQWALVIRNFLDEKDLKYDELQEGFLLRFNSAIIGSLSIRLLIEGDLIYLAAPLPVSETDQSFVTGSILQHTSEMMFYRIGSREEDELSLVSRMPLHYLDADWLDFLVNGLAQYADIPITSLRETGQLQAHFRSQRDFIQLIVPHRSESNEFSVASFCQEHGWPFDQQNDRLWIQALFGRIEIITVEEGVRIAMNLGNLKVGLRQKAIFKRMVAFNNTLGMGKLAVAGSGEVQLLYELPSLDQAGLSAAMKLFQQHVNELKRALV